METNSGLVKNGDVPVALVELISSSDGTRRVQLCTPDGIFLCQHVFEGDDDLGHKLGLALYTGYASGYLNAEINTRAAIEKALREHGPTKI